MAQGESPDFARRRVRLALREARLALNHTQSDVAEAMEWSLSKVQRIEKGEITVAPNDLRPLLAYLGIKTKPQVDDLMQAAKVARQRRQWWDEARFRQHVTSSMLQLAGFEADAAEIYQFTPMILPGAAIWGTVPILEAFDLYYLGNNRRGPEENAVMYRESGDQDEIVDDVEKVGRHRGMFDRWWNASHDEAESLSLIGSRCPRQ